MSETVHWEDDPTLTRTVLGYCKRCRASEGNFEIVSPQGTAHHSHEFVSENTACGIDATGEDWWWRT